MTNNNRTYLKIKEACAFTGLSQYYLRQGCKRGDIPHIRSGGVIYINIPLFMEKLEREVFNAQ